jgi:hypothetical protein
MFHAALVLLPTSPLSLIQLLTEWLGLTAAKNSFAGWKSPKGFSVPSSLGVRKADGEC